MTNPDKTLLVGVIDRSGSMAKIAEETAHAWNNLVAEQSKEPGELTVTLAEFDDLYNLVYQNKPAAEVPEYELRPRNYTALLDAIGKTINTVGAQLASMAEDDRPGLVLFTILTDGLENSSREFDPTSVKALVTEQQDKYGWVFQFLGANQDAVLTARSYGMRTNTAITYDVNNTAQTLTYASASMTNARAAYRGGARGQAVSDVATFTDEQRKEAVEK